MNYFWNFGTPSISRELFELETTNLARRLTSGGTNHKNKKLGQRWSEGVTWPTFGIVLLSISRERFELETSNLASRLTTGGTNDKNEKLGQKGREGGHVNNFWNFGTPSISRELLELETSNLACRLTTGGTNDKSEKIRSKVVGNNNYVT